MSDPSREASLVVSDERSREGLRSVSPEGSSPVTSPLVYAGPHAGLFHNLPKAQQAALLDIYSLLGRLPNGLDVTVGNLKGGVSKTTTAVFFALMLGLSGDPVLLVDCDSVNKSALLWSMAEDWPRNIRVVAWAGEDPQGNQITGRMMADRIRKKRAEYRHVIVDTGPQMAEYVRGALRETRNFVICSSPYPMDTVQIKPSVELASEVEASKDGPVFPKVLLSRVVKNTTALQNARSDLAEKNIDVFNTAITALQHYALTAGIVPNDFLEYVPVLRELVDDEINDLDGVE